MAANKLVIVESPTKAKTIGRMLGAEYTILASMGHVRDLPERSIGVDTKNHFAPMYVENPRSAKIMKEIKAAAKKADSVYLAPDPDREGEAIAWHLQELLKGTFKGEFKRVTFHEITKSAIEKAFLNTSEINMSLVDAQQARRVLDRLVGYMVSPLLWSQVEKGVSAGRVQSVALRLICEREREILAFVPEEFWNLSVLLQNAAGDEFESRLFKINDDKFKISNQQDALAAFNAIQHGKNYKIGSVEFTPKSRNAPPPFTTSTLQQAANNLLKFSASNTMRVAQQLYEGMEVGTGGSAGLITYMRTDSVVVAKEAQLACREFIADAYGKKFLPGNTNLFKSKAGAQEAHEAIRPTDVTRTPESLAKYLDPTQLKLYSLIWKRFVASQMASAEQRQTTVDTDAQGADGKKYTFRATALVTVFPGFMKVYDSAQKVEDEEAADTPAEVLGRLTKGDACTLKNAVKEQKFTEPPPRFTEATLIKELETNGIGRPSTYATIIQTIQAREYVAKDKGKLCPSELGFRVNDFLLAKLPDLIEVDFTSRMESHLDEIEEGKLGWTRMLDDFYNKFIKWLDTAKNAGSPETSKAASLVNMLNQVKWAPAEKNGRRSYDDKKFFGSVREKFATDNKITARQWDALIGLAAKYAVQLPELNAVAAKYGFSNELAAKAEVVKVSEEKRLLNTATADDKSKYAQIFSAFAAVTWDPPQKNRGRVYDDKKFFDSLKKQAESGKTLSDKQLNVISRFAAKYKDAIPAFDTLNELLGTPPEAEGAAPAAAAGAEDNSETGTLLKTLAAVTEWEEPVQKGSRTFNDKTFYESLAKQAESGKQLSSKQVFALKKMADKYSGKKEE